MSDPTESGYYWVKMAVAHQGRAVPSRWIPLYYDARTGDGWLIPGVMHVENRMLKWRGPLERPEE